MIATRSEDSTARNTPHTLAAPLFIGRDNAQAVIGRPWRWVRDAASALGVPMVRHGRATLIPAQALTEALLAAGNPQLAPAGEPPPTPSTADDVLAALGKRRKSA